MDWNLDSVMTRDVSPHIDQATLNDWARHNNVERMQEALRAGVEVDGATQALQCAVLWRRMEMIDLLWTASDPIKILYDLVHQGMEDRVREILAEQRDVVHQRDIAESLLKSIVLINNFQEAHKHEQAQAVRDLAVMLAQSIDDPAALLHTRVLLRAAEMNEMELCKILAPKSSDDDVGTAMLGLAQSGNVELFTLLEQHMSYQRRPPIDYLMGQCIEGNKHHKLFELLMERANDTEKCRAAEKSAKQGQWDRAQKIWGQIDQHPLWIRSEIVCQALRDNDPKMAAHFMGDLTFGNRSFFPNADLFLSDNWRSSKHYLRQNALQFALKRMDPDAPIFGYVARALQEQHVPLFDQSMAWAMQHRDHQQYDDKTVQFLIKQLLAHRMNLNEQQTHNFVELLGPQKVFDVLSSLTQSAVDHKGLLFKVAQTLSARDQIKAQVHVDDQIPNAHKRKM